jgi:hypothetical protein
MLTSFRQKAKIHIPVLPDSLDRREFLKKTFGYLKEAVGRYCGKRQDTMPPGSAASAGIASPHFEIRPVQSISPDAYRRVVSPT